MKIDIIINAHNAPPVTLTPEQVTLLKDALAGFLKLSDRWDLPSLEKIMGRRAANNTHLDRAKLEALVKAIGGSR